MLLGDFSVVETSLSFCTNQNAFADYPLRDIIESIRTMVQCVIYLLISSFWIACYPSLPFSTQATYSIFSSNSSLNYPTSLS